MLGKSSKITRERRSLAALAALLVLLAAHAAPAATSSAGGAQKSAFPNFEREWVELANAAKREGRLIVSAATSGPTVLPPLWKAFEQKFGIAVTVGRGSGAQQINKLLAERRAGLFQMDIIFTGLSTMRNRLLPSGALAPIKDLLFHPEVIDRSLWRGGVHRYADPEQRHVFLHSGRVDPPHLAVNTKLVRPGELNSYWDLLEPKWRGRIVSFHPTRSNEGHPARADIYYSKGLGPEFLRRLYSEAKLVLVASEREYLDGLAGGAYAIGFILGPAQRQVGELQALGLPVAIYRTPGKGLELETSRIAVAGMGPVAAVSRAANPNAQKLFLNWFFSREGQTLFQSTMRDFQSFRADIPNGDVIEEYRLPPPPDPIYVADADVEAQKKQDFATEWIRNVVEKLGL
jgi:ABC-type Fe3+ transport system substrate-binding protein